MDGLERELLPLLWFEAQNKAAFKVKQGEAGRNQSKKIKGADQLT